LSTSATAFKAYTEAINDGEHFIPYFLAVTPERELGKLNIGSRPARRGADDGGVKKLRAIPWVFAWTQNRLMLTTWLGFGEALGEAIRDGREDLLHEMVRDCPFFGSTLDLIEMVLAKSEPAVSAYYERLLVPSALHPVGERLRENFTATRDLILRVLGHHQLLEDNPVLRRSIEVRNPYVDPLNLLQAELLRRSRSSVDREVDDALLVTVNGLAAGLRNTG